MRPPSTAPAERSARPSSRSARTSRSWRARCRNAARAAVPSLHRRLQPGSRRIAMHASSRDCSSAGHAAGGETHAPCRAGGSAGESAGGAALRRGRAQSPSVISLPGCHTISARVPMRPRNRRKFAYSLWTRCGPMSTTSPEAGCNQLRARPPRSRNASSTVTRSPASASATAQDKPARPPPTTIASSSFECIPHRPDAAGIRAPGSPRCGSRLRRQCVTFSSALPSGRTAVGY